MYAVIKDIPKTIHDSGLDGEQKLWLIVPRDPEDKKSTWANFRLRFPLKKVS